MTSFALVRKPARLLEGHDQDHGKLQGLQWQLLEGLSLECQRTGYQPGLESDGRALMHGGPKWLGKDELQDADG